MKVDIADYMTRTTDICTEGMRCHRCQKPTVKCWAVPDPDKINRKLFVCVGCLDDYVAMAVSSEHLWQRTRPNSQHAPFTDKPPWHPGFDCSGSVRTTCDGRSKEDRLKGFGDFLRSSIEKTLCGYCKGRGWKLTGEDDTPIQCSDCDGEGFI